MVGRGGIIYIFPYTDTSDNKQMKIQLTNVELKIVSVPDSMPTDHPLSLHRPSDACYTLNRTELLKSPVQI